MSDIRHWLIDHTGIGVSDIYRSERFYEAVLAALGMVPVMRITGEFKPAQAGDKKLGGVGFGIDYPVFWIDMFHPHGVKQHTAFRAVSRQQVHAFHEAGVAAGGTDNGGPGLRTHGYPTGYYAAFILDPDGNNVEAVYREA